MDALRDLLEHAVARFMAEGVVDDLEAIDVQVEHCYPRSVALSACHRLAQAVGKQAAVGEAGEAVVVGEELDLALLGTLHRNVQGQAYVMGGLAMTIREPLDHQALRVALPALAPVPDLALPEAGAVDALPHRLVEVGTMHPRRQDPRRLPHHLVGKIAAHLLECFVHEHDRSLCVGDHDRHRGELHHALGKMQLLVRAPVLMRRKHTRHLLTHTRRKRLLINRPHPRQVKLLMAYHAQQAVTLADRRIEQGYDVASGKMRP